MEFHSIELTYFELKYILEYLQDNAAKQVYIANCLANTNLNEISKRISYLINSEEVIKNTLKYIEDSGTEFKVTNLRRQS